MKSDIDSLMKAENLDALLVMGAASHNPYLHYFTGNVHLHGADLIIIQGQEPLLFYHSPMEREEAQRTGLQTRSMLDFPFEKTLKELDGDRAETTALRYQWLLKEVGLESGRMGIYGMVDFGPTFEIMRRLEKLVPEVEIVGEIGNSLIGKAMETKDDVEAARLRRMGEITADVVAKTAKFLQSHKAVDGVLTNGEGEAVTVGDVKRKIDEWAVEAGVENPHGCIFAIGRDAGIPHSAGNPDDNLELGKTIVFDIFLQEPGGGYHADFTRTWSLGYATKEAQKLYDDVRDVFEDLMGGLEAYAPMSALQDHTNDLFEAQGHPTNRSHPGTLEGYVHGIGHGLGLNIHEYPFSRDKSSTLKPGVVVTIEPGLYYPEQGMGVRIEDTVYVHPDGQMEVLADYPHDLVLEIEEG